MCFFHCIVILGSTVQNSCGDSTDETISLNRQKNHANYLHVRLVNGCGGLPTTTAGSESEVGWTWHKP